MILGDTSVWIDHLRNRHRVLKQLLELGLVLTHSFVIGELACGNLKDRSYSLRQRAALRRAITATDEEVLDLMNVAGCGEPVLAGSTPTYWHLRWLVQHY
jgi:predicted nucleic acid-binding protein